MFNVKKQGYHDILYSKWEEIKCQSKPGNDLGLRRLAILEIYLNSYTIIKKELDRFLSHVVHLSNKNNICAYYDIENLLLQYAS